MEPDEEAYEHARHAYNSWGKRNFSGSDGWDCYLFEREEVLEMYFAASGRPGRTIDLDGLGVTEARLNLFVRGSREPHFHLSGPLRLQVKLDEQTEVLATTVHSRAADAFQVAVDPISGSSPGLRLDSAGGGRPKVELGVTSSATLEISNVSVALTHAGSDVANVRMTDAGLDVGNGVSVGTILAAGKLKLQAAEHALVERLVADGGSVLTIGQVDPFRCDHFEAGESTDEPITIEGRGFAATIANDLDLTINRGSRARIEEVGDLVVSGSGQLNVSRSGERVTFVDSDGDGGIQLDLDPWCVVRDATGTVRLGTVQHAEINGTAGAALEVHSIVTAEAIAKPTDGLLLRNFRIPVRLAGLQTIRALTATAAVAVPAVHPDLPGQPFIEKLLHPAGHSDTSANLRADYARALAGLADSAGAPGSIVTSLAWREYRMRQATARTRWEKWMLCAYRGIGYGERSMPAFLTYFVLAFVFTMLAAVYAGASPDLSQNGLERFSDSLRVWLIAPLHVLRLGSPEVASAADESWASALGLLGRVTLAVALVTAVLALRKYVKRAKQD